MNIEIKIPDKLEIDNFIFKKKTFIYKACEKGGGREKKWW